MIRHNYEFIQCCMRKMKWYLFPASVGNFSRFAQLHSVLAHLPKQAPTVLQNGGDKICSGG